MGSLHVLPHWRRVVIALAALLAAGCLRVRAHHSTITAASADETRIGFGLGTLDVTMSALGASSESSSTYVEHAARVREGAIDGVWRTRIVSARGAIVTTEALELCDGADGGRCVGAMLLDPSGAPSPVQGQPVLLEPANLGTSEYFSTSSSTTYGGATLTTITATGTTAVPGSHPRTPAFGVWALGAPVTTLVGGFGDVLVSGGAPMFCHAPDPSAPVCRAAREVAGVRAVLGVHLLRREGDLIHVAWFQPQESSTSSATSIVRCEASDRDGQPTCRTIEVP